MSVKISDLTAISGADIVTYASSAVFPIVSNSTGNLTTYKTSISSITTYITSASINFTANVSAANLTASTGIYGTIRTATQNQITSLGTLTGLTVNGTATINGNINTSNITVSGITSLGSNANVKITGGSSNYLLSTDGAGNLSWAAPAGGGGIGGANTYVQFNDAGSFNGTSGLTFNKTTNQLSVSGNVSAGNVSGTILSGTLSTAAQPNVTSLGTLTSLTVSGTLTTTNIIPSANNVSNIGSSTNWYNRVFSISTEALYADLAEKYTTDADYEPGTVVVFGGDAEITVTNQFADTRVAGIISTDPAYVMNAGINGLPVALRGRVPCKVIGPVAKGDLLVTSDVEGYAKSLNQYQDWAVTFNIDAGNSVFAKSLENNDTAGPVVIEAVVV